MRLWPRKDDADQPDADNGAQDAPTGFFAPVSSDTAIETQPPFSTEQPISAEQPVSTEQPISAAQPATTESFETEQEPVSTQIRVREPGDDITDGGAGDDAEADADAEDEPSSADLPLTERRSGRNMVAATVVGLSLLGIVLTSAWFHPLALAVVLYSFCIGASIEWRRALDRRGRHISLVPIVAATLGMASATWFGLAEGLAIALLVGAAGVVAWRVVDERIENTMADSLASLLTLMWIPFLASFFMLMVFADNGWQRVVIVVVAVVGNDAGGLYAGMAFGKHPFAPRISPKKTWEGAVGGVLLGGGAATLAAYFLFDGQWWVGLLVGIVCAAAATAGDLAESAIKRDMQVKDMSHAIPGHGGIMDRLDSVLVAAPAAYLTFAILMGTT